MKYLPHTLIICMEYEELVPDFMTVDQYVTAKAGGKIKVHGRGGNGRCVLIEFETMPDQLKQRINAKLGDVYEYHGKEPLKKLVTHDMAAMEFFGKHELSNGGTLPLEVQQQYRRQAEWFNMVLRVLEDKRALKDALKIDIDTFYKHVLDLHQLDKPINPELPVTYDAFRKKLNAYKNEGYKSLISKKYGNQNRRIVTTKIEGLLLSLYCMPTKPYLSDVCKMYGEFITGARQVVDMTTGEVFDRKEFFVDGEPYVVSAETVKHYVNKPINRVVVDEQRMSKLEFDTTHMPSTLRKAPVYAFSKITMDDTSSPFKMHDNTRPACYKIFDVASGAMIALAMHRRSRPDVGLVRMALADMMQQIIINEWKMPHEIEVENAITSSMTGNVNRKGMAGEKDRAKNGVIQDVLSAGTVFPIVHFCAAENPKEKRAEGFIKQIKYGFQKHREGFQHRIFARNEANRANKDGDSHKLRFDYEQIVEMEHEDARQWNNSLHPNQELYPNMTRWQVLEQCQNPTLKKPNLPQVMKYVGYKTETSVRKLRVKVQHNFYKLPDVKFFEQLNNKQLDAYWLPEKDGSIPHVFLYQDGEFVTYGNKEERFQEARVEQTEDDLKIMGAQQRYKDQLKEAVSRKRQQVFAVGITQASGGSTALTITGTDADEAEDLGKYADVEQSFNEVHDGTQMDVQVANDDWMAEDVRSRAIDDL